MHRLEGDDLWSGGVGLLQQLLQVPDVIVAKDQLPHSAVPDSLDH